MRSRFKAVCDDLGIESDGYYEILDDLYSAPRRFYHNWNHIESVLNRLDQLVHLVDSFSLSFPLLKFAAFYHDAVYVPGFPNNELLSAYLAEHHLTMTAGYVDLNPVTGAQIGRVHRWIMTTKNHSPFEGDVGGQLLCDADLYELGTENYGINGVNVRREFGAFDDHDWKLGRTFFLRSYLERLTLFSLPSQYETEYQARANMEHELATLSA